MINYNKYPEWVKYICNACHPSGEYYLYKIECDFNYHTVQYLSFWEKIKYKKLFKKINKSDEEWIKCFQIANKFYLKSDIYSQKLLYDLTTDLLHDL